MKLDNDTNYYVYSEYIDCNDYIMCDNKQYWSYFSKSYRLWVQMKNINDRYMNAYVSNDINLNDIIYDTMTMMLYKGLIMWLYKCIICNFEIQMMTIENGDKKMDYNLMIYNMCIEYLTLYWLFCV